MVDDDPKLVHLLREILTATGYEMIVACSGDQAIEMVAIEQPDLIILDIILLGEKDGYEVAQRIRGFSDLPIIMLTAKVREKDMLRGFDVGVDDYIKKPFSSKELLARIRAVLNRSSDHSRKQTKPQIICGEVHMDLARRRVFVGGRDVHLTPKEYSLLHELALHCNQVMLHEQLLAAVWGPEYRSDFDYLRSYIHLLRRKIEPDPSNPRIIIRVPGVGYMLETDGDSN
ncbi:MAG: response regulator transcription factor [Anaerolineales bacterium]